MSHVFRNSAPSRRALLGAAVGFGALAAAAPAHAARDQAVERYVQDNVREAMRTLNDPGLTSARRQQAFSTLMERFSDVPRIANYVLGRYGPAMRADRARWGRWLSVFRRYSTAVYESQLNLFQANSFEVTGSTVNRADADVTVHAQVVLRGASRPQRVGWRLLKGRDGQWRVLDIRMLFDGNEVWLSDRQQAEFMSFLDGSSGDLDRLIAHVERTTQTLLASSQGGRS